MKQARVPTDAEFKAAFRAFGPISTSKAKYLLGVLEKERHAKKSQGNLALRSCGGCERVGGGPRLRARGPGESVVLTPIEPPEPSWRQTLRACARCLSACVT